MTKAVAEAVSIPVTASGMEPANFLAASIFHFGKISIADAKQYLKDKGISVRK